jgi:hypothetical protein
VKLALPLIALGFAVLTAAPASAQANGNCKVGLSVTDRAGKTGTVVSSSDPTSCWVQFPDGKKDYYLGWMLRPAGGAKPAAAAVATAIPAKKYQCYASGNYLFMDLIIKDGSNYTDGGGKAGKFAYDPKTQMINFQSGPFKGQYSKYRGKDGIGLASKPTTFWATVCQ